METTPHTVRATLAQLRELPPIPVERRQAALEKFWQQAPLEPPQETGPFPWAQVELGIDALARSAPHCSEPGSLENPGILALILAGNTPLLAWPALHYCVLLGIPVFIKQSRDETIWARHFVETLARIDPEVAALLHLDLFPGDDPRTQALVQHADAVIAYGGDEAIAALRAATPETTPFQGFGHALSVALFPTNAFGVSANRLRLLWRDILTYDQAGCLSPQALYFQGDTNLGRALVQQLQAEFEVAASGFPPRRDLAESHKIREVRDLALMEGCEVTGDSELRWTFLLHESACSLPQPTGLGVLHIIPLASLEHFGAFLGPAKGCLSSVGVTLTRADWLSKALQKAVEAEGVSRIARTGEMQTPPLDWRNGGVDLRAWLEKSLDS